MTEAPQIYVIDDDESVRKSICALLRVHGYASEYFSSSSDFLSRKDRAHVGVLITDLAMPGKSGMELQSILVEEGSPLSVIVVSGVADVQSAVRIMESGAITLLEKPFSESDLLQAVRIGLDRSRKLHDEKMQYESISQKLAVLSEDQRMVLEGMLTGRAIKSCASQLHFSTRTVERYRKAILEMLGAESVPELAVMIAKARGRRPPKAQKRQD